MTVNINLFSQLSVRWTLQGPEQVGSIPQSRKLMSKDSLIDIPYQDLTGYKPLSPIRSSLDAALNRHTTPAPGAQSMAARWGSLDDTLVQRIVSFLPNTRDQLSCALVCKQWYAGAIAALYHSPKFVSSSMFQTFAKCVLSSSSNVAEFVNALRLPPAISSTLDIGDIALCVEPCSSLQTFELASCSSVSNILLESLALSCQQLQRLSVTECPLTDALVDDLATCCPLLADVNFANTDVTMKSLTVMLAKCRNLESVNLSRCNAAPERYRAPKLAEHPNLTTLVLDSSNVSDAALNPVVCACPHLQTLVVSRCSKLSDSFLVTLARSATELRILDISYNELFSSAGLSSISRCVPLQLSLELLNLSGCLQVTPESIALFVLSVKGLRFVCMEDLPQVRNSFIQRFNRNLSQRPWGLNTVELDGLRSYQRTREPKYCSSGTAGARALGWSPIASHGGSSWHDHSVTKQSPSLNSAHKLRHSQSMANMCRGIVGSSVGVPCHQKPKFLAELSHVTPPPTPARASSPAYSQAYSQAYSRPEFGSDPQIFKEFDTRFASKIMSPNSVQYSNDYSPAGVRDFSAYPHPADYTGTSRRPLALVGAGGLLHPGSAHADPVPFGYEQPRSFTKLAFRLELIQDSEFFSGEETLQFANLRFAGRLYNANSRGKCLVHLKLSLTDGYSESLYLHEFDDPTRLASDFANSCRIPSFIKPLANQIAYHKRRALLKLASQR